MASAPVQPTPPVLELRDVTVMALKAPQTIIAAGVNWSVAAGEFWVVGAPQHSGKTDFLLTVAGLLPAEQGAVWVAGRNHSERERDGRDVAPELGVVFDGGQLLNSLTLAENIGLPLRYHTRQSEPEIAARVGWLLEVMELTPWANVTPANVPRNWQQRAGLARALAVPPALLLLDSPFTGLDGRHLAWWRELLGALARGHEGLKLPPLPLVATADDLRPWRGLATHLACLHNCELVVLGNWADLTRAQNEVVATLLRD